MKQLLLAVSLIMMSISANAITINKGLLQHNGEVTLYDGDKLQDAVNAASDGDVLYLTLGSFKPFNVTKKITIIGTGETTIIDGDVNISIPGSAKLTSPVLEALAVSGTVNVGAQVDDMIIRKCKIADFTIGAQVDGAVLDRCYITHALTLSSYIKGMTVVNSIVYGLYANSGATSNTTFVNSNLYLSNCNNFSGTIINSIVRHIGNSGKTLNSTVLLNTLIMTYRYSNDNSYSSSYSSDILNIGTSSVRQGCYTITYISDSSTSSLQSNGYLGTDGTVVGIYGGDTPYTLEPSVPKVTSSDLKLDMEQKKLNVTLTVSPQ